MVLPLDSDVLQISVGAMPWTEASKATVGFCQPLSASWLSPVEVSTECCTPTNYGRAVS